MMPHRMAAACQHASAAGCATTVLEMLQTRRNRLTPHILQLPMVLSSAPVSLPTSCRCCEVVFWFVWCGHVLISAYVHALSCQ
jgi:hypothetical protein